MYWRDRIDYGNRTVTGAKRKEQIKCVMLRKKIKKPESPAKVVVY